MLSQLNEWEPITSYPNRPPHVLGVTTIRNLVMPVVDLRSALTGESLETTAVNRMIIVQVHGKEIGLVVDSATDVLDITPETVQHPNLLDSKNISYLKGITRLHNRAGYSLRYRKTA